MAINKWLAELVGTFILVFVGSLSILAAGAAGIHPLLVAPFGFGLGLAAGLYAVGHVSGGHFNPAVTLAAFIDRRTSFTDLVGYWIGQIAGALLASLLILAASSQDAVAGTTTAPGQGIEDSSAVLLELALTAIFVMVILASTRTSPRVALIAISLTLVAIHFAAVSVTGASVNPARSLGPAVVGGSLGDIWIYIVGPLVGAVVAWGLYRLFPAEETA
ncbi:MAG: MIP/aquaporin family protein [Acidimicrobiia bacterium]